VSKKKDKRKESLREICMEKKRKKCNGFSLNPHDINRRRLDHKIQHKEFNFCDNRTNKKRGGKKE